MIKTFRIMDRATMRQKGWWLFGFVVSLQILFVLGSYLMQGS
ncbi:KGW motif small protein [Acinetobacter sp. 197]